jgi:hypothetical protein
LTRPEFAPCSERLQPPPLRSRTSSAICGHRKGWRKVIQSLQEVRMRMDQMAATQPQLVQTTDEAKVNSTRIDSLERRLDRAERNQQQK